MKSKQHKGKGGDTVLEALRRDREERQRLVRKDPQSVPRWAVYEQLPAFSINDRKMPTAETQKHADKLFDERIRQASAFKSSKIEDKRLWFQHLLHTAKRAMYGNGAIQYPRNRNHPDFSKIKMQVVECAIEKGLLHEQRSPKGSPRMSRLLPMPVLNDCAAIDPWEFDPNNQMQLVFLRNRDDKSDLLSMEQIMALHPGHIARDYQRRLETINQINNLYEITHLKFSQWENDFIRPPRQLRPIHYVIFTERWDWHGRIYTGPYGHQSLTKIERRTIEFNGYPCVELDYSAMHTRLLYHLHRIDYRQDPYKLWGSETTRGQRLLAKTVINAALNAKSRKDTVSVCNLETSIWTSERDRQGKPTTMKEGDALQRARQLLKARKESGLTFGQIYDLVAERHPQIAQHFGSDAGIGLMRIDSSIAIDIMYSLAKEAIPCLCCHDSFIVPEHHGQHLRELMNNIYRAHTGFFPIIK